MPPVKQSNDQNLTPQHIAELENSERITSFFGLLGYDVDQAMPLTHASLGMDTDNLQQYVQQIRRIATDPDEEITVILFEVRSVTVALTQAIAQRFRQRLGNYLLVLTTKEYEKLDFVLLERIKSEKKQSGEITYVIRPRILTVSRRNPGVVALRVLKRFTFTEADAFYQWDKLRSAYSLAEWSEPDFNNRALFSDYYLKHRVTDPTLNPSWNEDVRIAFDRARGLFAGARDRLTKEVEQKTRAELIEPLFKLMGFTFVAHKSGSSSAEEPDYFLYAPDKPDQPIALALTYKWNRNLDSGDPRDTETRDENPGALIVSLLEKGDAPWVIMTNGKLWRLYSATASNKITNYYEVDLEEALFAPDRDREPAFKYWWLMFRRDAFTGFLDKVLAESQDYAKQISERLKDRIFKRIFGYFAGGFIDHMRAQDMDDDQIDRELVFNATMTFLYRLMFVLYAESLELVPVKEENGYGAQSVRVLKDEIARIAGKIEDEADDRLKLHYDADSTALYERLRRLFTSINQGDSDINLPVYNGGLFSAEDEEGTFLSQYAIPDVYLAIGLDRLARDVEDPDNPNKQQLVFIDFKSLGVRQLGSIYEGLLEFKLRIAGEKLAVIKDGKREVYMPHAQAVKAKKNVVDTVQPGKVYIENTKQERKATGSYYTPDYIVKYIVQHTVGPVLDEKFAALRSRIHKAQMDYHNHKKNVAARGADQPPELFWQSDEMQQLADDCLNIRVLDPAMGSGHFLVEAVDYISNRLIDFLNAWSENPVWALLERTRTDILAEMDRQGVSIDDGKLTPVVLLKRSVLKRCVYGVDLNEMAVELAKVSLWLDAFTLGAPLSFLDHHLKWGNSLIGARVTEVQDYLRGGEGPQQIDMFARSQWTGLMMATDLMRQVSYLTDSTIAQANSSKTQYHDALARLEPYKRILDVYTSRWFGNAIPKGAKSDNVRLFLKQADVEHWLNDPAYKLDDSLIPANRIADTARRAAQDKCFFHWELEFPEVFFAPSTPGGQDVQLRKDGGFDAVVGNPPYIPTEQLEEIDKKLFVERFAVERKYETSAIFVQHGLILTSAQGRVGMITPITWQTGENYERFRIDVVFGKYRPIQLVNLPFDVFPDAYIDTGIQILCHLESTKKSFRTLEYSKYEKLTSIDPSDARWQELPFQFVLEEPSVKVYMSSQQYEMRRKLRSQAFTTLGKVTESTQGIVETFYEYADQRKGSSQLEYRNMDVYRYDVEVTESKYIKMGKDDPFYRFYTRPRLLFRRIVSRSNRLMAISVDESFVVKKDLNPFIVNTTDSLEAAYLLALANCSLFSFLYIGGSTASVRDDFRQTTLEALRALPVRSISFTTPAERRAQLVEQARSLYERSQSDGAAPVLAFTAQCLAESQTDVIHDLLAFLAQQMIDLNKRKQSEVRRFLGWLESRLDIRPNKDGDKGIDSLKKKTYIQNYLGDYQKGEPEAAFDDFFFWLHDNRTRFGVPLPTIKVEIEDEYQQSLDVLLPIKRQLAHTDSLIDRIVYQLYGLTDEEIRLIEYPALEQAVSTAREDVLKDKDITPGSDEAIEKIAEKVEQAATPYFARVDEVAIQARLRAQIAGWDTLPEKVQKFLLTGELMLEHNNLPDYSGVVISFGKAAESLLNERIFSPFRQTHRPDDCTNDQLQRFMRSTKTLSLGAIGIVLPSSSESPLRAFVRRLYPQADQTVLSKNHLLALLSQDKVDRYRNGAAHDAELTIEDARNARQWAFAIVGYV